MLKIVIVGGGFGGVRAALNLSGHRGFDVKLISDHTYFEYHAALYRSATGRSPLEVAIPLEDFFADAENVEVVHDKITEIRPDKHVIESENGSSWHYDVLIMAVGSVTAYYGVRGLKKYSFGVKTIHQALELKRHLHDNLIAGYEEGNYVVIGAGATGVELAAELTAYLKNIRAKHKLHARAYNIDLIEASDQVLPLLPADFAKSVQHRLQTLSVNLYLNTPVKSESYKNIQLPSGSIESQTVIWTAGMTNNPLFNKHKFFKLGKGGKVVVDEQLQAVPDIFIIGDGAATQYSGMAQTAIHDANFVTRNLKRRLKNRQALQYKPQKPVYAIPVGPHWSAVLWGRLKIFGYPGWVLRRLADLRLYWRFLPFTKALTVWRYGIMIEESCEICRKN